MGRSLPTGSPAIAIVGTRRPTVAGLEVAALLARGLAQAGFAIVSGLAVGIDAAAHQAALGAGGHTVAVLGCGLSQNYPRRNLGLKEQIAERGTILTEYDDDIPPAPFNFPQRNRIVAGLSTGVVVVEGSIKSGALVTARLALEMNRSIYAVPGSLRNPMAVGPNHLIKTSQAALVTTFKDICDDLAPSLVWGPEKSPLDASDEEMSILGLLDDSPVSPDQLISHHPSAAGKMAMLLAGLEVKGWVRRAPSGYTISSAGARVRAASPG
jgi:DNA processing protein